MAALRFALDGPNSKRVLRLRRRVDNLVMPNRRIIYLVIVAVFGLMFGAITLAFALQPTQAQEPAWQTFTSDDAAYSFEYPAESVIQTSEDASLRYKLVYVQFPITTTGAYQGVSVMVIENPSNQNVRDLVATQYAQAKQAMPQVARSAVGFEVNGRAAIKLERDLVAGDLDKYSVWVQGEGVTYRINLFGGGVGGEVEPTPETEAIFNRLVQSFKILDTLLKPHTIPNPQSLIPNLDPPIATVFTYPLRSGVSQGYGVPTGIVVGGTRMEWLDYGIRNLDQWRTKCYGVDWSRMIHTGEDWYRDDYLTANTAGSPVYAVADGVVAQHNPGISYPGNVVLIRHRLANGRNIYSMYGHVANVSVVQGQQVKRGQQIATVLNQGYTGRTPAKHPSWDSHMHFEMRYFENGANIYVPGTNAYGYNYPACTYAYPGRGYTYIVHPDAYPYPNAGWTDGSEFIAANLEGPTGCMPQELLGNGNFELGRVVWGATNSAGIADPLIYTSRPRTGKWGGWLGNRATYTDTLSQVIQVPANSQTLRLSFWRYVQSKEATGNVDDKMSLVLRNPDGLPIATQEVATSATPRNVWQQFTTEFNLLNYAFATATLSLTGANDGDLVSSFFVDDVSLQKLCSTTADGATTNIGRGAALLRPYEIRSETNLMATSVDTPTVFLPLVFTDIDSEPNQPEKDMAAPACANLLVNGDFEASLALPWSGIANTPGAIYNVIPGGANTSLKDTLTDASRARSGFKSGRVGSPSVNGYWNELVQTVRLPANVTSASLSYWRYLDTRETTTTTAFDRFEVGLESDKGIQLLPPQKFDNKDAKRGQWVQETLSLSNPSAYSGQSVWVTVKGNLDNTNPSSFLVDDVELTVCAQP